MQMKPNLGRCSEHLLKAVKYLAVSSGNPQEKVNDMSKRAPGFLSIVEEDFPNGGLRNHFQLINARMKNIMAISDEEASDLIEKICELSDDVARAVGKCE